MIELIKKQIIDLNPCSDGLSDLMGMKTNSDVFDLFWKYIDFSMAKNFPDKDMLKRMNGHIEAGIIADRRLVINNKEKLVILGKSDIELNCSGFIVSRVYVKHDSVLYINASDNAYIVVDALDNAQVMCTIKGQARVVVNLYASATSTNATKTIIKNKETYDLQVR
jgi:hypothetical protein